MDIEKQDRPVTVQSGLDIRVPQGMIVFRGGDLRLLEIIGEGDMGTVHRVHIRSSSVPSLVGTTGGVKIVKAEIAEDKMEAVQECSVLMKLSTLRNVVTPFGLYLEGSEVGLVLERLQGSLLSSFVQRPSLNPLVVLSIMQQIFFALSQMHRKNIAHMDVKPSNIILESRPFDVSQVGTVKLFDFGIANDGERTGSVFDQIWDEGAGSIGYQAPEVFNGEFYRSSCADVWGGGVVWAELATGNRLFAGESVDDYLEDVEAKVGNMESVLGSEYISMIHVRQVLMGCLE